MAVSLAQLTPMADPGRVRLHGGPPAPNAWQLALQEMEIGLFIHFGMNTFTGEGTGGRGQGEASLFNPTHLDCDGWMEVARAMGAAFAVLTARHEEGFCLWPTATTDYCLRASPFRQGKADVVREFVDACRRYVVAPCLYHSSLMDARHIFQPGDPIAWFREWFESTNKHLGEAEALRRFTQMQVRQVRELLSNYGPIHYLWLDHIGETQGVLREDIVEEFWLRIVEEARRCQPHCLLLKVDVHLSRDLEAGRGVHGGQAAYPLWHTCRRVNTPKGRGDPVGDPQAGNQYVVWESNTIFSGGWFWNGDYVKPVKEMIEHYCLTVGRGSTFLPNFAPDPTGRMTPKVLAHANQFGQGIRALFGAPLAQVEGHGGEVMIELPDAQRIDRAVLMEDLTGGQRIAAYVLEGRVGQGPWRPIVTGQSVGHKRIERFAAVEASAVRFRCTRQFAEPVRLRRLAVFPAVQESG